MNKATVNKPKNYTKLHLFALKLFSMGLAVFALFSLSCGIILFLLICNKKSCKNGHKVEIDAVYCSDCGAVSDWNMVKKVCQQCGNETTDLESTYCNACGNILTLKRYKSELDKYDLCTLLIKVFNSIMIGILTLIIWIFMNWHIADVTLVQNKSVFLTRESAEKALKEMEDRKNGEVDKKN